MISTQTPFLEKILLIGASPNSLAGMVTAHRWKSVSIPIDPWGTFASQTNVIFFASAKNSISSGQSLYRLSNGGHVLIYDPVQRTIRKEGNQPAQLSDLENKILHTFVQRAGESLYQKDFYPNNDPKSRVMNAKISNLHRKFKTALTEKYVAPFISKGLTVRYHSRGRTLPASNVRAIPREQWIGVGSRSSRVFMQLPALQP